MMKISEIYNFLDNLSPFNTQATWDNSGLLIGDLNNEIKNIYISLDIDEALITNAEPNSLLITHHPLIFKPLNNLAGQKYPKNLIKKMLNKNLSLISMHTNYDLSHLNMYFAKDILGFDIISSEDFVIYTNINLYFKDLIALIKQKLNLSFIKTTLSNKDFIKTLAICTGSGGDLIPYINADCFLSGDFKYHQALEALNNDLALIDIDHFVSENCFAKSLFIHLQNLPVKVIISNCKNPFSYF